MNSAALHYTVMVKMEVFSWRLSSGCKAALDQEARRRNIRLSDLLDEIASDWLAHRRAGKDEAEQATIRKRAAAAIGSVRGRDLARSARASQLVRELIARKHAQESRASRRPH